MPLRGHCYSYWHRTINTLEHGPFSPQRPAADGEMIDGVAVIGGNKVEWILWRREQLQIQLVGPPREILHSLLPARL